MQILAELIAVLEEEVLLGETLLQNLVAQKKAILAWDSSALLKKVEEKEILLRQLSTLDGRREEAVHQLFFEQNIPDAEGSPALKILLAHLPSTPQTATLDHLQRRAWQIYSRLRAGEKHLTNLMGILLNQIGEA